MYKNELFRCCKDLYFYNGQIAFTKGRDYYLKGIDKNNRLFRNNKGDEHMVNPTEFGQHFRVKTD